jgi:hypothetical protein
VGSTRRGRCVGGGSSCCCCGGIARAERRSSVRPSIPRHYCLSCCPECSPCPICIAAAARAVSASECCRCDSETESGMRCMIYFTPPLQRPILAYVFTWPTCHHSYYMWFLLPQAKIPDELIAREVVINDADPSVRYKLTKRQTQDEVNP